MYICIGTSSAATRCALPPRGTAGCLYIRCIGARQRQRCQSGRECACEFTGSFRNRASAASFKVGSCIPAGVGVCFALRNLLRFGPWRWSHFLTCWALQFCLLQVYCRFYFCFSLSFSHFPPPPGLRCMHTVQMLGLKWLTPGKTRSMPLVSLERDGAGQPCSLFVLFELCQSLLSQAETPDRIHS